MMLKKLILCFILNILFIFCIFSANAFADDNLSIAQNNVNGVNILVDPRTELISAIQMISGNYDFMLTQYDFEYKEDMKNYFSKYKDHKSVELFSKFVEYDFDGSAIPTAVLYLSDDYSFNTEMFIPDELINRIGKREEVYEFLSTLKDFAELSDFNKFYDSHKAYYDILVNQNSKILENKNYIEQIENYYGMKNNSYNIILAPIFWNGGFNGTLEKEENKKDVISMLGTRNLKDGISQFGDEEQFEEICMHEFSHSFVNPTTNKNIESINKYSDLLKPIFNKMVMFGGYGRWDVSVNEHIIRAVVIRLSNLDEDSVEYKYAINEQKEMGFYYIESIIEKLKYYEDNRQQFKSFEEFYSEIINVFEQLNSKKLSDDFYTNSFTGNLNSVIFMNKPIIAIRPTYGIDKKTQNEIHNNLKKIIKSLEQIYPFESKIVTDEEALNMNLEGNNIIVIGTLESNSWIKHYIDKMPFVFEDNKLIIGEEVYKGKDLKLVIASESIYDNDTAMMMFISDKPTIFPKLRWYNNDNYSIWDGFRQIKSGAYYIDSNYEIHL